MVTAAKFGVYQRRVCTDIIVESFDCFIGGNANNFGGCGFGETSNEGVNSCHGLGGWYWWDNVFILLL